MQITKDADIRFVSHLDYLRAIERSIRRAELPVEYSSGFNPHLKFSLASALGVGIVSSAEFVEMEMAKDIEVNIAMECLQKALPNGIRIIDADVVASNEPPLMAKAGFSKYKVHLCGDGDKFSAAVNNFNNSTKVIYKKQVPKHKEKFKEVNIKDFVNEVKCEIRKGEVALDFEIQIFQDGSLKARDVLNSLGVDYTDADIERVAMYRVGHLPMLNSKK